MAHRPDSAFRVEHPAAHLARLAAPRAGVRGGVPAQRTDLSWESRLAVADPFDVPGPLRAGERPAQIFAGVLHAAWMSAALVLVLVFVLGRIF